MKVLTSVVNIRHGCSKVLRVCAGSAAALRNTCNYWRDSSVQYNNRKTEMLLYKEKFSKMFTFSVSKPIFAVSAEKEKACNPLRLQAFFLVEISGIEPLTS